MLGRNEAGDRIHRPRPVQGDDGRDILDIFRLEAHAHAGHAGRFHLEHAAGAAVGQHLEGLRVVIRDGPQIKIRGVGADHLNGVVQHR